MSQSATTLNQAFLVLILDEGVKLAKERRVRLDEARLQLLAYFLQRLGTGLTYIFDIRYSGPHSRQFAGDLNALYGPHLARVEAERARVRQNLGAFLPLELDALALLGTVDAVHRSLRKVQSGDRLEREVAQIVASIGRGRYPAEAVADTYRHYVESLLAQS
jgi:hypothetical protein